MLNPIITKIEIKCFPNSHTFVDKAFPLLRKNLSEAGMFSIDRVSCSVARTSYANNDFVCIMQFSGIMSEINVNELTPDQLIEWLDSSGAITWVRAVIIPNGYQRRSVERPKGRKRKEVPL